MLVFDKLRFLGLVLAEAGAPLEVFLLKFFLRDDDKTIARAIESSIGCRKSWGGRGYEGDGSVEMRSSKEIERSSDSSGVSCPTREYSAEARNPLVLQVFSFSPGVHGNQAFTGKLVFLLSLAGCSFVCGEQISTFKKYKKLHGRWAIELVKESQKLWIVETGKFPGVLNVSAFPRVRVESPS